MLEFPNPDEYPPRSAERQPLPPLCQLPPRITRCEPDTGPVAEAPGAIGTLGSLITLGGPFAVDIGSSVGECA